MRNLDLRDIPVAYINLDRDSQKKLNIEKTLQTLGFKYISRVPGVVHPTGNRAGCSMAQHNALHEFEPPFIILEDDATPLNFNPIITIPDDADAVYLGISSWGRMNGHSGPFVQYENIDDNLHRVYNMFIRNVCHASFPRRLRKPDALYLFFSRSDDRAALPVLRP